MGLEWLYRLLCQPRRWRRILVAVPLFSWKVIQHGHTQSPQPDNT
jgi:N-acetylglucosaminyldiphosphoundecaprenol N-acetyl-beta-D-mannosaminyltransferase